MELMLKVENGAYWYRPERRLFTGLDFELHGGEIAAVLGPNGVGKTTFLRCLMGLLRWREGRTLLGGRNIASVPSKEFWRTVAYVPQARALPFSFTVTDVVLMGRTSRVSAFAQPGPVDKAAARAALERMGVARLEDRKFGELSGGEAQLVFIARALAAEPRIIVLDEPESHLDFRNQLVILGALKDLAREDGIACVVNTHFPEHALRIADRALVLGKGSLGHRFGRAEDLMDEATLETFFGVRVKRLAFSDRDREYRAIYPLAPVC